VLPFKEVQLVQMQHHGAKLHKRATYGQKVQYTYISQKHSFYKIELRCDFNMKCIAHTSVTGKLLYCSRKTVCWLL